MNNTNAKIWDTFKNRFATEMRGSFHGWTDKDEHGHNEEALFEMASNPHHLEGDIFTHTAMVANEALKIDSEDKELFFTAVAHDLGKPFVRDPVIRNDVKKVRFFGHDYMSALKAINFCMDEFSDKETVERIINCIALHTMIFREDLHNYVTDEYFFDAINRLSVADRNGRFTEQDDSKDQIWTGTRHYPNIDPDKPWFTIMIGIPGSCKSSHGNKFGKVFSTDDTMEKLAVEKLHVAKDATYTQKFSSMSKSKINWTEEAIGNALSHVKDMGENVVLDATNLTRKKRKGIVRRAKTFDCNIRMVMMWRDFEDCVACRKTDKHISMEVYKRMIRSFSYPQIDEYDKLEHVFVRV